MLSTAHSFPHHLHPLQVVLVALSGRAPLFLHARLVDTRRPLQLLADFPQLLFGNERLLQVYFSFVLVNSLLLVLYPHYETSQLVEVHGHGYPLFLFFDQEFLELVLSLPPLVLVELLYLIRFFLFLLGLLLQFGLGCLQLFLVESPGRVQLL